MSRPSSGDLDKLYEENVEVWDVLRKSVAEVYEVLGSEPIDGLAGKYRRDDGGHLLFRPIGQQAFADALGVLRARGFGTYLAIEHLAKAPMELSQPPWRQVLWDPNTRRMINSYRTVAGNLFLHMVGQVPKSRPAEFYKRYKELDIEEKAPMAHLPVNPLR